MRPLALWAAALALSAAAAPASAQADDAGVLSLTLRTLANPSGHIVAADPGGRILALDPGTEATRVALLAAKPADRLDARVDSIASPHKVLAVEGMYRPVQLRDVVLAMLLCPAALILFALLVTSGRPLGFLTGVDNKLSNSQTQLALWFGVVACAYAAMICLRAIYLGWDHFGGVQLQDHVLALTGLSGLTFGAAKAIGVSKSAGHPPPPAVAPRLRDLVENNQDQPDLGDFQMILITLVSVGVFAVAAIHAMLWLKVTDVDALPDVDTTLLSSFGVGQGAYLIKKLVLPPNQG